MVTAFTSGLRQRLYKSNVSVVTIKPGLVDTPMTSEFTKGFLWAKPSGVAGKIVKALECKKSIVYAPGFWMIIMTIIRSLPERVFVKMRF